VNRWTGISVIANFAHATDDPTPRFSMEGF
jgi:hypothetical protein